MPLPPLLPPQARTLLLALEGRAAQALAFPWDRKVDEKLLDNLGKYRRRAKAALSCSRNHPIPSFPLPPQGPFSSLETSRASIDRLRGMACPDSPSSAVVSLSLSPGTTPCPSGTFSV